MTSSRRSDPHTWHRCCRPGATSWFGGALVLYIGDFRIIPSRKGRGPYFGNTHDTSHSAEQGHSSAKYVRDRTMTRRTDPASNDSRLNAIDGDRGHADARVRKERASVTAGARHC